MRRPTAVALSTGVIRTGQNDVSWNFEGDLLESLKAPQRHFTYQSEASLRFFTTRSSLPRSSTTLTASCLCSPPSNGALVAPARCSQTLSLYSLFKALLRLSHALVLGKKAWQTWKQRPL